MSSSSRAYSSRYQLVKLASAGEEFLHQLMSKPQSRTQQASSFSEVLGTAVSKFKEAYHQQLTTVMYIAGAAMAPSLNARASTDKNAVEKLVVRLLPRPSSRSVMIGDVIAFNSPLSSSSSSTPQNVLIRRVAAVEGDEMLTGDETSASGEAAAAPMVVPAGNCWLLADNEKLPSSDVIDSRKFGFVPFSNIIGRVVYAAASRTEHGRVRNNPLSEESDDAVVEQEVDKDKLFTV
ncbi:MAG: hypothetical protein WDW38_003388 [Sanguina aurantia]